MSLFDTFKDSSEDDTEVDRAAYRERLIKAIDLCLTTETKPLRGVLVIEQDVGADGYELAMISLNANLPEMGQMLFRGMKQAARRIQAYEEMESGDRVIN